jgi:hypothetical protein
MSDRPPPFELWRQAGGGTPDYSRQEYRRLMVQHGHLIPGTPVPLACGWPDGQDPARRLTMVVTGDRDWQHPKILRLALLGIALGYLDEDGHGFELLVGDCPTGADMETRGLCERAGIPYHVFHARWDQMQAEGKPRNAAGPLRNREMLDALQACPGEQLVVAFHDHLEASKGTRDCVQEAKRRGLPVYLVSKL